MNAFFFRREKTATAEPVAENPNTQLERTRKLVVEKLDRMTFSSESGIMGLKVRPLTALTSNEIWLSVTGLIPNNEIGLGKEHLEPIAGQLNTELTAEAQPFRILVDTYRTAALPYGEDSAIDSASYILKIRKTPREEVSEESNVIHVPFDRR